ncbi:hypothetical protein AQI70_10990 [Streptomyces curacoi]|uniref:Uncharacterized protein n=1 Tax=Streptomyces curacoi TaxID=146536 RepID=A0A117PE41_9ACTN|nr:hypothetical protein AQI70_10990 [Streptomyces curacoi]
MDLPQQHVGLCWPVQVGGAALVTVSSHPHLHKAVHTFVTGALAARSGPGPGQRHVALRPGRHADVGPLPGKDAYGR